jgi:hypothetical protein
MASEPPQPQAKVYPFKLRAEKAQAMIREIAKDTAKVILGNHVKERIEQRDVSDLEIYRLLQTGHCFEEPMLTEYQEWKCKMTKKIKGNREAGVVTIILHDFYLFVKTVEWEDIK